MGKRKKFVMKRFAVADSRSGCKLGVDATLIGSWVNIEPWMRRVLDAGCGCGIISLMLAQRGGQLQIEGIDIEEGSLADARENISESPFADRITIEKCEFQEKANNCGGVSSECDSLPDGRLRTGYDMIVSNPPFYESGGDPLLSPRMLARHAGSLSPESLLSKSSLILKEGGVLGFIAPYEYLRKYLRIGETHGMYVEKICLVKGHPHASCKRAMLYMRKIGNYADKEASFPCKRKCRIEHLNIKYSNGDFTREYIDLGKDFYLKF